MLTENVRVVLRLLQERSGERLIAQDVADLTGLGVKSVNAIYTTGIQRKEWGIREEEERDGKTVKVFVLTDEGKAVNVNA